MHTEKSCYVRDVAQVTEGHTAGQSGGMHGLVSKQDFDCMKPMCTCAGAHLLCRRRRTTVLMVDTEIATLLLLSGEHSNVSAKRR